MAARPTSSMLVEARSAYLRERGSAWHHPDSLPRRPLRHPFGPQRSGAPTNGRSGAASWSRSSEARLRPAPPGTAVSERSTLLEGGCDERLSISPARLSPAASPISGCRCSPDPSTPGHCGSRVVSSRWAFLCPEPALGGR